MVTSAVAIIEPHLIDIGSGVHIVGKELVECYVSLKMKIRKENKHGNIRR